MDLDPSSSLSCNHNPVGNLHPDSDSLKGNATPETHSKPSKRENFDSVVDSETRSHHKKNILRECFGKERSTRRKGNATNSGPQTHSNQQQSNIPSRGDATNFNALGDFETRSDHKQNTFRKFFHKIHDTYLTRAGKK